MGNLALFYKLYQWWTKFISILKGEVSPPAVNPRDPFTVQYYLTRKGYWVIMDGLMGPSTVEAIKKFQTDNGLNPDGIIGKETWELLSGGIE
jgi:hypothetical protein